MVSPTNHDIFIYVICDFLVLLQLLPLRSTQIFFYTSPMRKLSLLVGALGGALAGYVFSNAKLREELSHAKSAEDAAHVLGKYMQRDGQRLGKQVKELIHSEEVQRNVQKAKAFVQRSVDGATKEIQALTARGKDRAKTAIKRTASRAKKVAKKAVRSVRG